MNYYKIIINNNICAVATSNDFVECAKRHKLLLPSDFAHAEFITSHGRLYHAEWMALPTNNLLYEQALILEITEEEYLILFNSLKLEESIPVKEPANNININDFIPINQINPYENLTIEQVKETKLKELSYVCNQTIESGIDVKMLDGKVHHFSLTVQDQLNLISLQAMKEQGVEQIPYHADGELCKFYTAIEIQMIITEATKFKTYHTTYYNALKNYINSLEDPYVIANIQYGIELPEEYQSDVLKALYD